MGAGLGRRPGLQQGLRAAAVLPGRRRRRRRPRAAQGLRHAAARASPSGCATTPSSGARVEQTKLEILDHPRVHEYLGNLWDDGEAADPGRRRRPELRPAALGRGADRSAPARCCATTPNVRDKVNEGLDRLAGHVATHYADDLTDVISTTVARWDTERDQPAPRAAGRARPAVHPHQRHRRRRAGRAGDLHAHASCSERRGAGAPTGLGRAAAPAGRRATPGRRRACAARRAAAARAGSTACSRSTPCAELDGEQHGARPGGPRAAACSACTSTSSPTVRPISTMTTSACSCDIDATFSPVRCTVPLASWSPACGPLPVTTVPIGEGRRGDEHGERGPARCAAGGGRSGTAPSSRSRHHSRNVTAMIAIDSRKCSATSHGLRWVSTVNPPSTACAGMPRRRAWPAGARVRSAIATSQRGDGDDRRARRSAAGW